MLWAVAVADVTWWWLYTVLCVRVCVCVFVGVCWPAVMPTLPRPWQLPRWLTQIDRAKEERNAHTCTRFDTHTHTHTHTQMYTCVGTLSRREARVVPPEQVREESKSFYGFIFGMTPNFPEAAKFHVVQRCRSHQK